MALTPQQRDRLQPQMAVYQAFWDLTDKLEYLYEQQLENEHPDPNPAYGSSVMTNDQFKELIELIRISQLLQTRFNSWAGKFSTGLFFGAQ